MKVLKLTICLYIGIVMNYYSIASHDTINKWNVKHTASYSNRLKNCPEAFHHLLQDVLTLPSGKRAITVGEVGSGVYPLCMAVKPSDGPYQYYASEPNRSNHKKLKKVLRAKEKGSDQKFYTHRVNFQDARFLEGTQLVTLHNVADVIIASDENIFTAGLKNCYDQKIPFVRLIQSYNHDISIFEELIDQKSSPNEIVLPISCELSQGEHLMSQEFVAIPRKLYHSLQITMDSFNHEFLDLLFKSLRKYVLRQLRTKTIPGMPGLKEHMAQELTKVLMSKIRELIFFQYEIKNQADLLHALADFMSKNHDYKDTTEFLIPDLGLEIIIEINLMIFKLTEVTAKQKEPICLERIPLSEAMKSMFTCQNTEFSSVNFDFLKAHNFEVIKAFKDKTNSRTQNFVPKICRSLQELSQSTPLKRLPSFENFYNSKVKRLARESGYRIQEIKVEEFTAPTPGNQLNFEYYREGEATQSVIAQIITLERTSETSPLARQIEQAAKLFEIMMTAGQAQFILDHIENY